MEKKELIRERLREGSADGRLSCRAARKLAEELGVRYKEVGEAADELKIRITDCELGCF